MTNSWLPLLRQAAACLDGALRGRSNRVAIVVAIAAALFATR